MEWWYVDVEEEIISGAELALDSGNTDFRQTRQNRITPETVDFNTVVLRCRHVPKLAWYLRTRLA